MKKLVLLFLILASCVKNGAESNESAKSSDVPVYAEKCDTVWAALKWQETFSSVRTYSFPENGILGKIAVVPGRSAASGMFAVQLTSGVLDSRINAQRSVVSAAEKELARVDQLYTQQARTAVQREDAQAALSAERSRLDELLLIRKGLALHIEKSSTVISVLKKEGEYIHAGEPVFSAGEGKTVKRAVIPFSVLGIVPESSVVSVMEPGGKAVKLNCSVRDLGDSAEIVFESSSKANSGALLFPFTGNCSFVHGEFDVKPGDLLTAEFDGGISPILVLKTSSQGFWTAGFSGRAILGAVRIGKTAQF